MRARVRVRVWVGRVRETFALLTTYSTTYLCHELVDELLDLGVVRALQGGIGRYREM
jgi:hypothetical protein